MINYFRLKRFYLVFTYSPCYICTFLASLGFELSLLKKVHLIELTKNREAMNNKKDEKENKKVKELV